MLLFLREYELFVKKKIFRWKRDVREINCAAVGYNIRKPHWNKLALIINKRNGRLNSALDFVPTDNSTCIIFILLLCL